MRYPNGDTTYALGYTIMEFWRGQGWRCRANSSLSPIKKKKIVLDSTTSSSHFHPTSLLSFIEKSPLKSWPNPISILFSFSFEPFSVRLSSPLLIESILFNVTNLLYQMVNSQSSIQFLGNIWHY